jgi:hypothetical protein
MPEQHDVIVNPDELNTEELDGEYFAFGDNEVCGVGCPITQLIVPNKNNPVREVAYEYDKIIQNNEAESKLAEGVVSHDIAAAAWKVAKQRHHSERPDVIPETVQLAEKVARTAF